MTVTRLVYPQDLGVERGDVEKLQSRLQSHQTEMTSLERQLHEARAGTDRAKKQKKTAEDKIAELTRESHDNHLTVT